MTSTHAFARAGLVVALLAGFALWAGTPAQAAKKLYPLQPDRPATLIPEASADPIGPLAITPGTRYTISGVSWATIRNAPGDLTIGNAAAGWSLDATRDTDSWRFGYVYNSFSGCGWLFVTNLTNTGTGNVYCSTAPGSSISRSTIAVTWNGQTNCQPDGSCDGSGVRLTCQNATGFANARPWLSQQAGGNAVSTIANNQLVYWRYKTPDLKWVLVRNGSVSSGNGNWQFVLRSCFGALPNERSINVN